MATAGEDDRVTLRLLACAMFEDDSEVQHRDAPAGSGVSDI